MATELVLPEVTTFEQIAARAVERAKHDTVHAALVCPNEPDMLCAVARATSEGLIEPIVIGDRGVYEETCKAHHISLRPADFICIEDPVAAVEKAASLVADKRVELLVKGRILTTDLLKLLFRPETGFARKDRTVSHVTVMKPAKYPKLLLLTDAGVVVQPDLKTKIDLIQNMVLVATMVGIKNPRIAALAAVEVVYPQMQVTLEAAVLAKMSDRGQIKGAIVDGPLSFDCAVDMFAAQSKGIKNSAVAGQADGLLAPNIETANGVYKAMALYGKCEMGGVIVGGKVPISIGSRSDTAEGKYHSLLLGVLTAPCRHSH